MFLLLLLVIASVNGVVSSIQSHLTPEEFAAWGPGYAERVLGEGAFQDAGRVYWDATGPHPRPFGLGSDTGFGGLLGVIAIPAGLALIATGRRRLIQVAAAALLVGAAVAIVASQQRTSVIAAMFAALGFAVYATVSGRALRTIGVIAVLALIGYGVVVQISAHSSYNPYERYSTIAPSISSHRREVTAARAWERYRTTSRKLRSESAWVAPGRRKETPTAATSRCGPAASSPTPRRSSTTCSASWECLA